MAKKKSTKKPTPLKNMMELFYMTSNEITANSLKEAVSKKENLKIEYWEDMNILQLELYNGNTIDFEPMREEFSEDSDKAFVKNRNIKTIFYVTMEEQDFEELKPVLKEILSKLGGFFCTDSEKFQPIYTQEDLNLGNY